jgi:signal-transduction protein with cAMP-binding, CBS, and nucleotidyltransferase domain
MMTGGPPLVDLNTTVADVVKIMKQQLTSSVLVGEPGSAEGIISEADIVRKFVALEEDSAEVKAGQIMTSPLISVDIATPVFEVYRKMADHHIRHILVTDGGQQIGFISAKDLIAKPIF